MQLKKNKKMALPNGKLKCAQRTMPLASTGAPSTVSKRTVLQPTLDYHLNRSAVLEATQVCLAKFQCCCSSCHGVIIR